VIIKDHVTPQTRHYTTTEIQWALGYSL